MRGPSPGAAAKGIIEAVTSDVTSTQPAAVIATTALARLTHTSDKCRATSARTSAPYAARRGCRTHRSRDNPSGRSPRAKGHVRTDAPPIPSDQALPQGIGDRMRAVAQLQAGGDVVQHVLHRALGVGQPV